ncbi:Glyceraldehyde-3-phosphate dehydrogenase [Nitrosopumilaceae archaeon]|nr:type II glyceraldehyde-3-phosphate dehydrogenase [Nitrosopumilus sp.]CAI9832834.1 Glyceraldehyde-3-phosphate dehydrogenase [Nitrosopumilaceae archaeon]MDA7944350.1 type II glyceraldehyde-3-phosphate dehydrogenase [Nitrosopumilus sp.]MDA7954102.1 type II glyceraldehyde-3-phosphate dehydrogenase [Nitrosopumilus sp.]MDA7959553.1 type II glyceraldehyde-3-phosphate dehydrogenase [Nitrosopumilus sp.]
MKRVFVNGYGSIGRRIAAVISDDPEVELAGVGRHTPSGDIRAIASGGIRVYAPAARVHEFEGLGVSGTIESVLPSCDLVVDASPGGMGARNKRDLYLPLGVRAVYQGGETSPGGGAPSDLIFNSAANYSGAAPLDHVIQGSCNVTGMGRIIGPLRAAFPGRLERLDVTLVRRWADIGQDAEIPDTVEISRSPHHGDDVLSYMGTDVPLHVRAVKVPTRQMHLHLLDARFSGGAPDPGDVHAAYAGAPGVAVLWGAGGTRQVREFAETAGFAFGDTGMVHLHAEMTSSAGDTVKMIYSDDQTGIVIPDNHMLVQAMLFGRPYAEARAHTEQVMGTAQKRRLLEERFAR